MTSRQHGSFSTRFLPLSLLSLTLAFLSGPALRGGEPPPTPRLVAGAVCAKGERQEDRSRAEAAGITFEARPLPTSDWEVRLERRVAGMGSALRRRDGSRGPFQVFLMTVRNQSQESFTFQPGNIVRILGDKEQDHILDYTDLYRFLVEEGKDADSLDRIRDIFFDSGFTLDRGDSIERLLFFRELPARGKRKQLTLLLSSFQVGTETLRATLPWHFEKERR